jgi:hypothetical protein
VFGVPLAAGERVVYYRRVPRGVVGIIIAGVILLPFFLAGIFLFVRAVKMRKAESHANVITNRRIFTVNGDGQVLQEMPWSDVAGMTYFKRRRARHTVAVHDRNNRQVVFDEFIAEVQAFIQHVTANMRAIDSLPEQVFDVAPLTPVKAGRTALIAGLVMAGLGALTILLALVAVNESEVLSVGAVGGFGLLAGGVLAAVGLSAAKAR